MHLSLRHACQWNPIAIPVFHIHTFLLLRSRRSLGLFAFHATPISELGVACSSAKYEFKTVDRGVKAGVRASLFHHCESHCLGPHRTQGCILRSDWQSQTVKNNSVFCSDPLQHLLFLFNFLQLSTWYLYQLLDSNIWRKKAELLFLAIAPLYFLVSSKLFNP